MDEKREERQKESIEEILSDLNGLLNKMPAILEGIRLPEITPVDFSSPRMPEPAVRVLPPFIRPASAKFPEPEVSAGEETFDIGIKPEERGQPDAVIPEEINKPEAQSLGEYMFSRDAVPEPESPECRAALPDPFPGLIEPAGLDSAPELPEIKPAAEKTITETEAPDAAAMVFNSPFPEEESIGGVIEPEEHRPADNAIPEGNNSSGPIEPGGSDPAPGLPEIKPVTEEIKAEACDFGSLKEEEAAIESEFKSGPEKKEDENPASFFEKAVDFGAPDIDMLMKLSQEEDLPAKEAVVSKEGSEMPAGPLPAAMPAGDKPLQQESVLEPVSDEAAVPEIAPQPALEPAPENALSGPQDVSPAGEWGVLNPENTEADKTSIPADALESILPDRAQAAMSEPPVPASDASGAEPRIERTSPEEFTLKTNEPAPEPSGLVIEQTSSIFNSNPPAAAPDHDDKTVVIAPVTPRPEDDKTVIYEAGAAPGETLQGRADLGYLADRAVPDGIAPERVRTVAFLYAEADSELCAELLAELDAICLKSASKPMFIKRGFVRACIPGVSGNMYLQQVADAGAAGLICVGNVPQENVYEVENVFTAGGVFFRHFSRDVFCHSAALDLVAELILK